MGIPRFDVIENFRRRATETTYRGRAVAHDFSIALAYSGNAQIELIQHLSGETCYKDLNNAGGKDCSTWTFSSNGVSSTTGRRRSLSAMVSPWHSGRLGDARYTCFETEGAIGAVIEIVYLDEASRALMARIKREDF